MDVLVLVLQVAVLKPSEFAFFFRYWPKLNDELIIHDYHETRSRENELRRTSYIFFNGLIFAISFQIYRYGDEEVSNVQPALANYHVEFSKDGASVLQLHTWWMTTNMRGGVSRILTQQS